MGPLSDHRPRPIGKASSAVTRKDERTMRAVCRSLCCVMEAETAGMTEAVSATISEEGRL